MNLKLRHLIIFILLLILSACGTNQQSKEDTDEQSSGLSKDKSEVVVIDNNGFTQEFTEAPTRAISLNQHVTEIMLALGLEDSMIGTAYLDDEIYEPLQEAYEKIPVISDQYPSKEQVIALEPDFLYGGWSSAFDEKTIASQEELLELGIHSYLQTSSTMVAPKLEDIYNDIRNIAAIFRVEERGEQLIEEMNTDIAEITGQLPEVDKELPVLVFDSGETDIFTASQNFMNELITLAGGVNIFGDIEGNWTTVSKEEAVDKAPEVIVVVDYGSTTAQEKINFIKSDPALSTTPAAKNNRFVVLPLSAASEGVRVAEAIEILAKGFYPEYFN
ncbi:ABC transporter substrate-binding protein [Lysinibacillus telephonicus]|uniref:ABC transporter substrate-binding protein n=1 Tax=Lysinibacillus telephonicus TaxID=1714840 RepID=UPI003BA22302